MDEVKIVETNCNGEIIDTPGWNDSNGKVRSLENLRVIYNQLKTIAEAGRLNAIVLTVNEKDKCDDSILELVQKLFKCFGALMFPMLCIFFTKSELKTTPEEA